MKTDELGEQFCAVNMKVGGESNFNMWCDGYLFFPPVII